jgi:hypothetical protein
VVSLSAALDSVGDFDLSSVEPALRTEATVNLTQDLLNFLDNSGGDTASLAGALAGMSSEVELPMTIVYQKTEVEGTSCANVMTAATRAAGCAGMQALLVDELHTHRPAGTDGDGPTAAPPRGSGGGGVGLDDDYGGFAPVDGDGGGGGVDGGGLLGGGGGSRFARARDFGMGIPRTTTYTSTTVEGAAQQTKTVPKQSVLTPPPTARPSDAPPAQLSGWHRGQKICNAACTDEPVGSLLRVQRPALLSGGAASRRDRRTVAAAVMTFHVTSAEGCIAARSPAAGAGDAQAGGGGIGSSGGGSRRWRQRLARDGESQASTAADTEGASPSPSPSPAPAPAPAPATFALNVTLTDGTVASINLPAAATAMAAELRDIAGKAGANGFGAFLEALIVQHDIDLANAKIPPKDDKKLDGALVALFCISCLALIVIGVLLMGRQQRKPNTKLSTPMYAPPPPTAEKRDATPLEVFLATPAPKEIMPLRKVSELSVAAPPAEMSASDDTSEWVSDVVTGVVINGTYAGATNSDVAAAIALVASAPPMPKIVCSLPDGTVEELTAIFVEADSGFESHAGKLTRHSIRHRMNMKRLKAVLSELDVLQHFNELGGSGLLSVDTVVAKMDGNGDGLLTLEEFIDAVDGAVLARRALNPQQQEPEPTTQQQEPEPLMQQQEPEPTTQ